LELYLYSPSAFVAGYRIHFIFEEGVVVGMSVAKNEEIVADFSENDNERVL
jgi:leucyl aminopeptidase (aminopeptidase T)